MIKTLKWYANPNNYNSDGAPTYIINIDTPMMPYPEEEIVLDLGSRARQALEEVNMGFCEYSPREIELQKQLTEAESELGKLKKEYEELLALLQEEAS